jgi:hypothetical protein
VGAVAQPVCGQLAGVKGVPAHPGRNGAGQLGVLVVDACGGKAQGC